MERPDIISLLWKYLRRIKHLWLNVKSYVRMARIMTLDTKLKVSMGKGGWLILVQVRNNGFVRNGLLLFSYK
jgi:hypothetical protein